MWDTLRHTTSFSYDGAGRDTSWFLPDGARAAFGYDSSGNVTSVRPPGRPNHEFRYTPTGLLQVNTPPVVAGVPSPATSYDYNGDAQLRSVTRPDGQGC